MSSNLESKRPRKYKKKEKPEKKQEPVITTSKDQEDDESNDCDEEKNKGKVKKRKNERKKILYELHHTHNACDNPVKFKSKTHEILKQILNKNHNIPYNNF
tara:strand:+ start:114 stop:416 length:303 start_codon:yes stop_codon:yes gene_type:complete